MKRFLAGPLTTTAMLFGVSLALGNKWAILGSCVLVSLAAILILRYRGK